MALLSDGVSVEKVLALAPHVTLEVVSTDPVTAEPPTGTVWVDKQSIDKRTTTAQVQGFIVDVANGVDGRLFRRAYLTNESVRASIENAARAIITVGAAATLISAVFPTKAGINDQTSYSAELWARYNVELDALNDSLAKALEDEDNPSHGGKPSSIRGSFREPTITDDLVW